MSETKKSFKPMSQKKYAESLKKPIESVRSTPTSSPVKKSSEVPTGGITLKLNVQRIQPIAFELSQQQLSWNDLVWLVAEADMKLCNAFKPGSDLQNNSEIIVIDSRKIRDKISKEEITKEAEKLANTHPSINELHWLLAQRQYILQQVKKK